MPIVIGLALASWMPLLTTNSSPELDTMLRTELLLTAAFTLSAIGVLVSCLWKNGRVQLITAGLVPVRILRTNPRTSEDGLYGQFAAPNNTMPRAGEYLCYKT